MNPEIKERWVAALRSGEYVQGRQFLSTEGKYCCLGVLCDLAEKDGIVTSAEVTDTYDDTYRVYRGVGDLENEKSGTELPFPVMKWSGIDRGSPLLSLDGRRNSAIEWNDDEGLTFLQISQMIEEQL